MTQMTLAEYNHMIEALTSNRADQMFGRGSSILVVML
jgi:hypothetical protein